MGPLVVNMVKTVDTIFVLSAFKRANFQSKSTKLVSSSMFTCPNWCFKMYLSCFIWLTCFLLCVCVLLLDRGYILRLFFKEQNAFSIDTVICSRLTTTDPVLPLSLLSFSCLFLLFPYTLEACLTWNTLIDNRYPPISVCIFFSLSCYTTHSCHQVEVSYHSQ